MLEEKLGSGLKTGDFGRVEYSEGFITAFVFLSRSKGTGAWITFDKSKPNAGSAMNPAKWHTACSVLVDVGRDGDKVGEFVDTVA